MSTQLEKDYKHNNDMNSVTLDQASGAVGSPQKDQDVVLAVAGATDSGVTSHPSIDPQVAFRGFFR